MVFYSERILSGLGKKFAAVFGRTGALLSLQPSIGSADNHEKRKWEKARTSVSSVFTACGDLDCRDVRWRRTDSLCVQKKDNQLRASFTIEAVMVLTVVFLSLASIILYGYRIHDTVTGTMILEEAIVKARIGAETEDPFLLKEYKDYGERLGNPRLSLGTYRLELDAAADHISGTASADRWKQEMEIKRFQPGTFLRRIEAIKALGKDLTNDGSGIQAGDEPELYGDPATDKGT